MRRALLFMMLINSITCVTENLAMKQDEADNSELIRLLYNETQEKDNTDKKQTLECTDLEAQQPKKRPTKKSIAAYFSIFILLPSASIGSLFATASGVGEMCRNTSHIQYLNPSPPFYDYNKKPDCSYEDYYNDSAPGLCARGKCAHDEYSYHCVIERCEGAEQYEKSYNKAVWGVATMSATLPIIPLMAFRKLCNMCKKRAKS